MLTRVFIIQAFTLGVALAQERTFGSGASGSFFGSGSSLTTEGPIYQPIQGLKPNQHGFTLIDPNYARQYAQEVKKPALGTFSQQRPQSVDYNKQLEAQDAFIRQVAEANKKRVQSAQEFRPSQPLPSPPQEVQDFRFSSENGVRTDLGSEDFIRNPPPPPPRFPTNFEHPGTLRRPPPMATPPPPPPPPPHTPSLKNFPSIQPTNPPLVIPELPNQDLPELSPSLFSNNNNNFQMIEFQRTGSPVEPTVTHRAPVIRHRARPIAQSQAQTSSFQPLLGDERVFESDNNSAFGPVHKKRIQVNKRPIVTTDTSNSFEGDTDNGQFNEDVAKEQASRAQYEFQTSVQDSVNGQEQIRQETRDGLRLKGLYSYSDGFFKRTVYYVADENGYRVVKEESEPIGGGPQYDPDGQVNVESSFGGTGHRYSITGQQLEAAKRKSSLKSS